MPTSLPITADMTLAQSAKKPTAFLHFNERAILIANLDKIMIEIDYSESRRRGARMLTGIFLQCGFEFLTILVETKVCHIM